MPEYIYNHFNGELFAWAVNVVPDDQQIYELIEIKCLIPLLGAEFHAAIIASPETYGSLVANFIGPFMNAMYKYHKLNYDLTYNHIPGTSAAQAQTLLSDYLQIANAQKSSLIKHLLSNNYPHYSPPAAPGFISGIRIKP
jgi:hypothetical protein